MNLTELIPILIQGIPFIAVFAGLAVVIIMYRISHKFAGGIVAEGFRYLVVGLLFITLGILLDAFSSYFMMNNELSLVYLISKGLLFVVGMYVIVVGSKKMSDALDTIL